MSTYSDLVTEVVGNLASWTRAQELATTLTENITASDTSIPVAATTVLAAGLVEIDDEAMYVSAFDTTANVLTVAPYGRGWNGSVAATHTAGARVSFNPRFPRVQVKREINKVLRALGGDLHGVGATSITSVASRYTYELPAAATRVLRVEWQSIGPAQTWIPIRKYDWNLDADTTAFPSGKSIDVLDPIVPGQTIRVVYAKDPTELSSASDDFVTVTGLPASCEDVVVYGACHRLLAFLDAARLDVSSVSEDMLDVPTPVGSATNLSKYFFGLYQDRLSEERRKLDGRHQPRIRWTR